MNENGRKNSARIRINVAANNESNEVQKQKKNSLAEWRHRLLWNKADEKIRIEIDAISHFERKQKWSDHDRSFFRTFFVRSFRSFNACMYVVSTGFVLFLLWGFTAIRQHIRKVHYTCIVCDSGNATSNNRGRLYLSDLPISSKKLRNLLKCVCGKKNKIKATRMAFILSSLVQWYWHYGVRIDLCFLCVCVCVCVRQRYKVSFPHICMLSQKWNLVVSYQR